MMDMDIGDQEGAGRSHGLDDASFRVDFAKNR